LVSLSKRANLEIRRRETNYISFQFAPLMTRFLHTLALISLLLFAALLFAAEEPKITINIAQDIQPWQAYYDQHETWPKHTGWKPFKRFEWDMKQRAYGTGEIPAGALWEAFEQRSRMSRSALDEPWTPLGPFNHGGRTRTLRFHPGNPDIMYAGSVGGGLFRSLDAGNNWEPFSDMLPNIAIGCFEIFPANPNIMFLGTGEGYFNGDGLAGIGLLKSVNGGQSWQETGMNYSYNQGKAILVINLDPRDENIVLASTNDGLRRSINGGTTFTSVLPGNVNAIIRDSETPDVLLAGIGNAFGANNNGIYRSEDNGLTWVRIANGLPSATQFGRAVLTFYPSNTQIVYAGICGTFNHNNSQMLGVYRSIDNGQNWTRMSRDTDNHYSQQGWYDMAIAVKPDNSAIVFSSGLDLYKTVNSGNLWARKSRWDLPYGNPDFVHADHHGIYFHPDNSDEVWAVTDGGVFRSIDLGENWVEKNNGYNTFQYYAMGTATIDTALAYGGAQDNGSSKFSGSPNWDDVFGGDGGYCVVDYTRDNTVYVEWQGGNRSRSDNGGQTFSEINNGIDGGGAWVTPMILDPFDPDVIITTTNGSGGGESRVWRSPSQGRASDWQTVGSVLSGDMQVLGVTAAAEGRIYVGTGSSVYRYDTDGDWVNVSGNLPGAWVTRVTPDPYSPDLVYVTVSGFGGGHVWRSTTAGSTWTNISGNLPNIPFSDVVVDLTDPNILYAGSDLGCYYTENAGQEWSILGEGLPAVRIDDMEMQSATGLLRIATHGRGMWEIRTGNAAMSLFFPNGGETLELGAPVNVRWGGTTLGGNVRVELNRSYPGPTWETIFNSTPNDGAQTWPASGAATDHARFRIVHVTMPNQSDSSNTDSRIQAPLVRVVWPNGGETVFTGVRDSVRFERVLADEPLTVEINRDYPNGDWELIENNVIALDRVLWPVQLPGGTNCRVRVSSSTRPDVTDISDGDFIVTAPQMSFSAPVGGEHLQTGIPFQIQWSAPGYTGEFRIQLNRNYPDGMWENIVTRTANDGSHAWSPSGAASEHCRLRLSTLYDQQTFILTPADFTLTTLAAHEPTPLPLQFSVSQPYPNPFNPSTEIRIELPARVAVQAIVYNRLGQAVATLANEIWSAGTHTLHFDGAQLTSGIYFVRVTAGNETQMVKAALVK
jgi:photosystem II stability/assembly factor-like uncharacterized protein